MKGKLYGRPVKSPQELIDSVNNEENCRVEKHFQINITDKFE